MTYTERTTTDTERNWHARGGEIGALIRSRDWSESPLGPLEEWPQSLHSALEICLTSPIPISICWGSDLIFFYNDAWQKLLGENHPSALGSPAREVFADSWGAVQPMLEHVFSTGEAVESKNQTLPLRVFGNKKGYFDISFSPISDKGIFSIATESTDFVKLENAISENERQFQEMIDALPAAIYTTDAEGRLTHFNPAAVEFSGREPELGTDQWCVTWKLYHPDGTPMPHQDCPMAVALKEGRSVIGEQAIAERPDGKRIWFEPYPSPLHDSNGKVIGGINMLVDITERKQAEKQLRRNERELADFFENATLGLHWVGPDGTILRANQAELDLLGYSREEYVGRRIADFHADEEVIEDILQRLKAGEELHDYEARLRCKDGSIRHVLISSSVYREDGEFIHTRCFTRDITERKRAEEAQQRSEKWFRQLLEKLPAAAYTCDSEGLITFYNQQAAEVWGREPELNNSVDRFCGSVKLYGSDGSPIDHNECWMALALKNEKEYNGEEIIIERPDGRLITGLVYATPIHDESGKLIGAVNIVTDITERKRMEKALQESEERFRALVTASSDVVYWMSSDWTEMYHLEGQNFIADTNEPNSTWLDKYIHPDDQQQVMEAINEAIRTKSTFELEHRVLQGDGTLGWTFSRAIPILDEDGEIIKWFGAASDVTERKRAKEDLQQMNETLEERVEERTATLLSYQDQLRSLASELSKAEEHERQRLATELHDNLGQMLSVGKMKVDLLKRSKLSEPAASGVTELAELMDEAIHYTRELMSDLKPPPSLDKEDIGTTMAWVADKMKKHGLDVSVEDDGQPKLLGEEIRSTLLQSVRELLFNVVKHAGVGQARVVLSRRDRQVQINVEDEGKGFDMEGRQPAPTEEGGFGLFSIRERMNVLGGNLEVISRPGKGTKVILMAPLKGKKNESNIPILSDQQTNAPPRPIALTESEQRIRVLLVDDHQMVRTGLRKIIEEEADLTVIAEATDGKEAIKLARKACPNVVVMDVDMPGMNGIDATREISSDAPHVRVIGLSLHDSKDVAQAMREAGASAYLTKAEVFETLCATIRSEAMMGKE